MLPLCCSRLQPLCLDRARALALEPQLCLVSRMRVLRGSLVTVAPTPCSLVSAGSASCRRDVSIRAARLTGGMCEMRAGGESKHEAQVGAVCRTRCVCVWLVRGEGTPDVQSRGWYAGGPCSSSSSSNSSSAPWAREDIQAVKLNDNRLAAQARPGHLYA